MDRQRHRATRATGMLKVDDMSDERTGRCVRCSGCGRKQNQPEGEKEETRIKRTSARNDLELSVCPQIRKRASGNSVFL